MNIEMALKKRIGNLAGKIHTGKSRNDQVVTDLKLWIRERLIILLNKIKTIQTTLINKAEKKFRYNYARFYALTKCSTGSFFSLFAFLF